MLQLDKPGCWSEHETLQTVLVCSPSEQSIPSLHVAENVQWNAPVQQKKALENFYTFILTLQQEGVHTIDYSQHLGSDTQQLSEQLINRFFVRDLACVFGNKILPGVAGTFMRQPEYDQVHDLLDNWFPDVFIKEAKQGLKALEYGDVLILNSDAILVNIGMRTSLESVEQMMGNIFQAGFSEIGVISLPRRADTLHLDMNCNVASEDLIVAKSYLRYLPVQLTNAAGIQWYDMAEQFLNRHGFSVYWLEKYETIPDINFLNIDPETILISKAAQKQMLKSHPKLKHKRFLEIDVSELEKAGGGIRCMTLPLLRKRSI
ncbi:MULTISPECIES: arginine deiminase family protein [Clostridia]|uniref:arginine deiminase family protein n=1 Tax=Clostridia TaxID=186801 RepID=UPI000E9FFAE1|nr:MULTISPECIES: arginine deiminase family protein [Clostridia]NBJ69485.1 arginine deiminase [Roseburia sp. 1XD42-34]RKI78560.1 arginine deiminase [Clostridium sp. 1xD42-85]